MLLPNINICESKKDEKKKFVFERVETLEDGSWVSIIQLSIMQYQIFFLVLQNCFNNMASPKYTDDDVSKYLYGMRKGLFSEYRPTNPIAEYISQNSQREPDILRRLYEVSSST